MTLTTKMQIQSFDPDSISSTVTQTPWITPQDKSLGYVPSFNEQYSHGECLQPNYALIPTPAPYILPQTTPSCGPSPYGVIGSGVPLAVGSGSYPESALPASGVQYGGNNVGGVFPSVNDSHDNLKEENTEEQIENKARRRLERMIGIDAVKAQFKKIEADVAFNKRLGIDMKRERFHAIFQGNPGTGKTTVARLYARFLHSLGIVKSRKFIETSGTMLAAKGLSYIVDVLGLDESDNSLCSDDSDDEDNNKIRSARFCPTESGGILFIDEAYQLVSPHACNTGKQILDIIIKVMEDKCGDWVFIFAGYKTELELLFAHDQGLQSRIPYHMDFEDFDEEQLQTILESKIKDRYEGKMKIERGAYDQFMLAVIRRLARGRGRRGFGNARAVENLLFAIHQRHTRRLQSVKSQAEDLFFFSKEDLLGPSPSTVRSKSSAWAKLRKLIGLEEVKTSVENMFSMVEDNYDRELNGLKPLDVPLNRIFVGSPGTGKTTVAKLYGQILADLGFLSNGNVVIKKPADFIGKVVGESEANTKAILASTLGKVLIIDEAYMLDPGDSTTTKEPFKTAILDTLVAEVQSVPGDDRCVILLGYEDKMINLFQNGNPGLPGRFMADRPFRFADYSMEELRTILEQDTKERELALPADACKAAMDFLSRSKKHQNFSNAREVSNLVSEAIPRYHSRRQRMGPASQHISGVLSAEDFDPGFNQRSNPTPILRRDLKRKVSEEIISQLEPYERIARRPRLENRDQFRPIPTTFIFKGPAGTGKSTVARYMGKMYFDMGLLPSDAVVECTAADLIGQHVGHTAPKTRAQFRKGIGKVLIIDDAHQLRYGGFSAEAINELVSLMRKFSGKIVVILIGETDKMDQLTRDRPDLGRLFLKQLTFKNLSPDACLDILKKELEENGVRPVTWSEQVREKVSTLTKSPGWNNAGDVKTLAFQMTQNAYNSVEGLDMVGSEVNISEEIALSCIGETFDDVLRRPRSIGLSSDDASGICDGATALEAEAPEHRREVRREHIQQKEQRNEVRREHSQQEQQRQEQSEQKEKSKTCQEVLKMSKCVAGYDWKREGKGYRCEGGSHYMSDAEIEARR